MSLLKADESTCNGIIPHPTLPIFVTYGIASTAKLWRATVPVSDEDDDSVSVSPAFNSSVCVETNYFHFFKHSPQWQCILGKEKSLRRTAVCEE